MANDEGRDLTLRQRIELLLNREDFRSNPLKAFGKRLFYRVRWRFTQAPWTLWLDDTFRVDAPMGSPGAYIYYFGASEPKGLELVKRLLRPGMTFVDVGAHLGEYSLIASRIVAESGVVHAFEPGATVHPFLYRNLKQNFASNVLLHRLAVSDLDGQLEFNIAEDPGHSRLVIDKHGASGMQSQGIDIVLSVRLDTWVRENGNLTIDVVKIDVEGLELSVLHGAQDVLARQGEKAPIILFEYHPQNWDVYGYKFEDAAKYLARFGYGVYGYSFERGHFAVDNAKDAREASGAFDLILLAMKPEHQPPALR